MDNRIYTPEQAAAKEKEKMVNDGKMEVMGININISEILGNKIIDQYLAQLTDDEMKVIMEYISADFLVKKEESQYNFDNKEYEKVLKIEIKERKKDGYGHYHDSKYTIGELIRSKFNERIKEELIKKVEEIVATSDYQEKIDKIAEELVEYAINGYKEDLKNTIRNNLVNNVLRSEPIYGGESITNRIHHVINQRLGGGY